MRNSAELAAEPDDTLPRTDLPLGPPTMAAAAPARPVPAPATAVAAPAAPTAPVNPDFAARRTSAGWRDLDPREFDRLRRLVGAAGGRGDSALAAMSDEQIARSLGLVVTEGGRTHVLAGAVLLFGRPDALRRHVPNHEAALQIIGPETGEPGAKVNDFFRWPLLRLTEELLARFRARNPEREVRYELVRAGVPRYAEQAFRELLANAFVHRDYSAAGAVHVQWTRTGIEISSPGGCPAPGSGDALGLAARPPRPRSPLLADAFRRAGITDRTGRGIRRACAAQLRGGLRPPDHGRSTSDCVIAVLPSIPPDLAFALFALGRACAGAPLDLPELLVLTAATRDGVLRTSDVAALLDTDKDHARRHLTDMVGRGLMEIGGLGGTRVWSPSSEVRRALREAGTQLSARPGRPGLRPAPAGHPRAAGRASEA
ncbi:ATP-dependent DNA helicase RecG [Frankia sp. EI5c]|uniref:ATP-binding protein n=1 Tax=Frankia sp. EI5c TaxID=683316 RepID=UPI0007C3A182|nr:ATP-binding protein [Frankia sp. EI5c]OAA26212.1 ATP-dependent DNA helicase RecG [Frankia sp. EI5c]